MHWLIKTGGGRYNEQDQCYKSSRLYKQSVALVPRGQKAQEHNPWCHYQRSFGVSLLKNGRPRIVPPQVTHGLACHAVMMQLSSEDKAYSLKMRAIASALKLGMTYQNLFSTDYLWQRTQIDHPSMIMPAKAVNNKDRQVDWVKYKNIKNWNQKAKQFLVSLGMWLPRQGLICK